MQNLLFDLDGTLIDSSRGIQQSLKYALTRLAFPFKMDQDFSWCIGPPLSDSLRIILGPNQEHQVSEGVALYRDHYGRIGMYDNLLYPDTEGMLNGLRLAGHRLFVATSKPQAFAVPILERLKLDHYFEGVYGSGLDGTFGTKTTLIRHIMESHGLGPKNTWMIGDRKHDIIGANMNQIRSIGVLWGFGSREELEEAGATHLCPLQIELKSFLDR